MKATESTGAAGKARPRSPSRPDASPRARSASLGLHRVVGVRMVLTPHGTVAEAIAVLHRRPVVQRISMSTAAKLAAAGVPLAAGRLVRQQAPLDTATTTASLSGNG